MSTISVAPPMELRLAGRKATLRSIVHTINRHASRRPLRRVELRYSSQTAEVLAPVEMRTRLSQLMRELGLAQVELSLRPLELPIDDAMGEHVLRFFYADPVHRPGSAVPAGMSAWRNWMAGWWSQRVSAAAPPAVEPITTSPQLRREALALLQRALNQAIQRHLREHADCPVSTVLIDVGDAEAHGALSTLLVDDAPAATRWLLQTLQSAGVRAQEIHLDYRFTPAHPDEGTATAARNDLVVQLHSSAIPGAGPALAPRSAQRDRPSPALDVAETLRPDTAPTLRPTATVMLRLRVLGHLRHDFAAPFQMQASSLPMRLDRALLLGAGFGAAHPRSAQVLSQACPLQVEAPAPATWRLSAAAPGDAAREPMYHLLSDMRPIQGTVEVQAPVLRLLVNSPYGVYDPASGDTLTPLVIELAQATTP